MAGSAMDRVFGGITSAVNSALGRGGNSDPSQNNTTIPGQATNVHSNGTVASIPTEAQGDQSPLANYTDLFKDDPDKPAMGGVPDPMPNFAWDQNKLSETAKGIDFTKDLSAEDVAAAYPGVPEAAARKILNAVAAKTFETNFTVSGQGMEVAMRRQTKALTDTTIPDIIRRQNASQLTADLGYAKDPMTAPVFDMLKERFTNKFPDATPQQIATHTQKYMEAMFDSGTKANGKQIVNTPKARKDDVDWDNFIEEPTGVKALFN